MSNVVIKESSDVATENLLSTRWDGNFVHTLLFSKQKKRFIRFCLSGLTGVFVNMGAFYILREFAHVGLSRSAIIAIELAIINNFFWNDRWTFQDIANERKGLIEQGKRFIRFNLVCVTGLILNILMLNILHNFFHINEYLANMVAIVAVTGWNFSLNLKYSWKQHIGLKGKQ